MFIILFSCNAYTELVSPRITTSTMPPFRRFQLSPPTTATDHERTDQGHVAWIPECYHPLLISALPLQGAASTIKPAARERSNGARPCAVRPLLLVGSGLGALVNGERSPVFCQLVSLVKT